MISVAIITAPRQEITVNTSIHSLRDSGFNDIVNVFAEPDSSIEEHNNVIVNYHKQKLGARNNWCFALDWLLENTKTKRIALAQDDVLYSKGFIELLLADILIPSGKCLEINPYRSHESLS